ncbi:MAG: hypothetical protein R3A45_01855 [Bdellovibrionota bacterium]
MLKKMGAKHLDTIGIPETALMKMASSSGTVTLDHLEGLAIPVWPAIYPAPTDKEITFLRVFLWRAYNHSRREFEKITKHFYSYCDGWKSFVSADKYFLARSEVYVCRFTQVRYRLYQRLFSSSSKYFLYIISHSGEPSRIGLL